MTQKKKKGQQKRKAYETPGKRPANRSRRNRGMAPTILGKDRSVMEPAPPGVPDECESTSQNGGDSASHAENGNHIESYLETNQENEPAHNAVLQPEFRRQAAPKVPEFTPRPTSPAVTEQALIRRIEAELKPRGLKLCHYKKKLSTGSLLDCWWVETREGEQPDHAWLTKQICAFFVGLEELEAFARRLEDYQKRPTVK